MTNRKQTKRALLSSVMALLLCFTMLLGTTFAWFTDTASTSVNTIQAGTLDVALEMKDGDNWVSAEGKTLSFTNNYWEPGCTYALPELRIVNNGNLALKYKVIITGINGDAKLNEVITWTIGDVAQGAEQHLAAGATSEAFTIKGTMSTLAGNAYQGLTIEGISITVYATQDTVEFDSTGNQYDASAPYSSADVNTTAKLITAGNLTINETLSIDSSVTNGNSDVIRVTGGNHTITGGSYTAYGTMNNSCLRVDGGNVTIKGGVFEVKENNNCIYAAGGNIIIEGGTFKSEKDYEGRWFTLNCQDNSGSVITIKGGAFYKFDPSKANTGKGEIVVAEGYKVVNNGDWYYVVPEDAIEVANENDLLTAATSAHSGDVIYLTSDLNVTKTAAFAASNIIIEGCGHTITCNSTADNNGITVLQFGYEKDGTNVYCTGVTVQNLTITGSGKGALRFHGGTSSVLNNVTVSGNWWLAVNLYGTHGAVMNNCDIASSCNTKYCSASIFANEASANQLILNNTIVDSVFVNASKTGSGVKLVVNDGSVINEVHSNIVGGVSRTYWAINGTGSVGNFINDIED